MKHSINLQHEMAWVTFMGDNWCQEWFAVTDENGKHLAWDSAEIMEFCREQFNRFGIHFGIARTSQMILQNAERDNL